MVKEDDEGRKRVKIYRSKDGVPKGDGLITYLKEPSVSLGMTTSAVALYLMRHAS